MYDQVFLEFYVTSYVNRKRQTILANVNKKVNEKYITISSLKVITK